MGRRIGTIPVRGPIERFSEGADASFEAEAAQIGCFKQDRNNRLTSVAPLPGCASRL